MQLAVQYGHIDIVEALVNHCENPNEPNPMGWSPIQTAARRGQDDVIRYLISIFREIEGFHSTMLQKLSKCEVKA